MTSTVSTDFDQWEVTNMMYRRVIGFACEVALERADSEQERDWVSRLKNLVEERYTIDEPVDALFPSAEEKQFWGVVLFELADRIYRREVGNQDNHEWQVATIWAAYDLARLLVMSSPSRVFWPAT
jgi:hypothetical protein